MISRLVFLLFCGHIALNLGNAQKLPRGQNLKVQINTTDDTICMKYLRLIPNTKLHGFILGYGSSFFSNQYIPLPSEGKSYVTEVDAEPRYLITVRAAPVRNHRKTCSGKTKTQKPLQLVVGTLTPNSVFLSWGILVNPQHDWTATSSCASDRFYTVRYREKDKNKKWGFQLCPTTETVVDNLKPNTLYEFGVKDNTEDGIWSKIFNHKTILSNKNKGNGHLQNTYKFIPNSQTQFIPGDGTKRVPITRIKQVIQNITHRILPKATDRPSLAGAILVHLIIPGLNETPPKFPKTLGMFETPKKKLIMNETQMWPAESKTPKVQEISPQSFPATIESFQESIKPTVPAASEKSDTSSDYNESELESTKPNIAPTPELSLNTLAHSETESGLEETNSTPKPELAQTQNILAQKPLLLGQSTPKASKTIEWSKTTLAPWETKFVTSTPKPSARPKMPQSKPAEKSIHLESNTPKFSIPLELPRTTLAPSKTKLIPSKPKVSLHPEEPKSKPAATRKPIAVPVTSKISSVTATTETLEHPKSTMVSYEPQHIPSKPKASASAIPEMPHSKPAKSPITPEATHKISSNDLEWPRATLESSEIHFTSLKPKSSAEPKMPQYKPAPTETQFIPSKPNTSPEPELLHSKPVLEPITLRIEPPKSTIAPKETRRVPLKPKPSPKPHVPQTKPALESTTFRTEQPKTPLAPKEVRRVPSKPKISPSPDVPQAKPAPKETQRVPSKPKTSPIPDTPPTKAAAKEIRRITSRPKTLASPEVPPTKPVPKEIQRIPSKLKTSASPDVPHTKPAGIIPSIQEPVTATAPYSLERAKATLAPKEIRLIPSKPKASVRPEAPQTKPVPNETYPISFKPQTALTTENPQLKTVSYVVRTETIKPKISKPFGKTEATLAPHKVHLTPARPKISDKPQTRPVLNKTTPGPGRTKTAGVVRWGGTPTEVVRDSTKFLMGSNVSLESNVTRKKIDSVAIPPDSRHPPVAPARPTQVRRKPLPPNTVTGKPGSPGISSTSRASASSTTSAVRPTGPTKSLKTEKPRKKPTVSASPEEPVNTTVFSSSPTSETDVQGQPRFKAPYVVYMPKGDNEPCSITSTLEHFPEEEASNKEDATNPPQNPPSNLTVVTVEGCPSFVVLNWTKPENDTVTEYKVVSTENGAPTGKEMSILTTNQTHSTVENLKPNTSYEFQVKAINPSGEGPPSDKVQFDTESADPRVSEPISMGKDAIWTEIPFNSNAYSECKGKQYVKRTWYKKFVGVQLCNSLRYKIYLSDSLTGKFYSIGDQRGHGEDHCQFVDSFLDGRTGQQVSSDQLPMEDGFFRAVRQEPVKFGKIGGSTHINYVHWYECGTSIPGKW
ncbi:target of Nesh-SH3 isoform X38 [Pelodiscus sinensis]|uniref:target of Nesh-SH3 isoform X38 n=1 Tax=Pelodiscus sinensis TaxID=13735 RepID=UPI003F6BEDEA